MNITMEFTPENFSAVLFVALVVFVILTLWYVMRVTIEQSQRSFRI